MNFWKNTLNVTEELREEEVSGADQNDALSILMSLPFLFEEWQAALQQFLPGTLTRILNKWAGWRREAEKVKIPKRHVPIWQAFERLPHAEKRLGWKRSWYNNTISVITVDGLTKTLSAKFSLVCEKELSFFVRSFALHVWGPMPCWKLASILGVFWPRRTLGSRLLGMVPGRSHWALCWRLGAGDGGGSMACLFCIVFSNWTMRTHVS